MSKSIIPDKSDNIEVALIAVAHDFTRRAAKAGKFKKISDYVKAFEAAYSGVLDVVVALEFDDDLYEDDEYLDSLLDLELAEFEKAAFSEGGLGAFEMDDPPADVAPPPDPPSGNGDSPVDSP